MKKAILLLFAFYLILICLVAQTAVIPAQGDGTETNPYQIENWQNLYWISQNSSSWDKHFIQTVDIDFTEAEPAITSWDNGQGWSPIGFSWTETFGGIYDGNNKTITGLYINRPVGFFQSLFGHLSDEAEIVNLSMINVNVTGKNYSSGLVGVNNNSIIRNCNSSGSIRGDFYTGGLAGYCINGTIDNCHSTANITGHFFTGGLVGSNSLGSTISNCFSAGSIVGSENTGGLTGLNMGVLINSYYNYDTVIINNSHIITAGALTQALYNDWFPNKNLNINNYLTLENSSYLISNINDFKTLLAFGQSPDYSFKLMNHLDLSTENNFYIPFFAGSLNGNDKTIINITINQPWMNCIGLFGFINNAHIYSIELSNINITGFDYTGGLAGYSYGSIINDCFISGNVMGNEYVGGLTGILTNESTLSNSSVSGIVRGNLYTGGLTGINFDIINNCSNMATVIGGSNTGGLTGWNYDTITNCYNTGAVAGGYSTSGLTGVNYQGTISNCYNSGNITGSQTTSGLIGDNYEGIINNCQNSGNVSGQTQTSGLVGNNSGNISNCYNIGNINGLNNYTGGLVSYNTGSIENSYNHGDVSGVNYTGGVSGVNLGAISYCYNIGTVNGTENYTGGLSGYNYGGVISNCYNTGLTTGESVTGGLVGVNDFSTESNSIILNCYSAGSVNSINIAGGLVGQNNSIIRNSFWDIETSGQSTSSGGTGLTTAEMKTISTYSDADWNIPGVWNIDPNLNNGYPYLNYPNSVANDDIVTDIPYSNSAVLHSAYPNPFNPSTTISFELIHPEEVCINIYNIKGQLVKHLVKKAYDKGTYSVVWDGKDAKGHSCGTGVYFFKMTAGQTQQIKKMMMMK